MSSPGSRKTPLQQPMLPNTTRDAINAWRRLLYRQTKDRQNAHRRLTLISSRGNINSSINPTPMHTSTTPPPPTTPFPNGHTCFLNRLSRLHPLHVCSICKESYPKMKTNFSSGIYTCSRCSNERHGHRFSIDNNMDPGTQPIELARLTQIEEMLIARVNPILQVTHARGGQYKYSGHTISFPQDISTIATSLPHLLTDLDILVVRKFNAANKPYEFIVSRSNVLAALEFKISNDPYYKDVHLDLQALHALPLEPTDVSSLLHHATTPSPELQLPSPTTDDATPSMHSQIETSSFVFALPNSRTETEEIRRFASGTPAAPSTSIDWPPIGLSPINEYNTEGLLSMAFPTLFPTGVPMLKQPRLYEVSMQEYALHLIRFHDNRFAQHPRFRYYLYNLMMRHRSQATAAVFVKRNLADTLPATVSALRTQLSHLPDSRVADHAMRFASSLRGTRSFWSKRRGELCDMITQLGSPTFFLP